MTRTRLDASSRGKTTLEQRNRKGKAAGIERERIFRVRPENAISQSEGRARAFLIDTQIDGLEIHSKCWMAPKTRNAFLDFQMFRNLRANPPTNIFLT